MNKQFLSKKGLRVFSLLFLFVNTTLMINAQELKHEDKKNKGGTLSLNYYADDLGYVEKYHGKQTLTFSNGALSNGTSVLTFDKGILNRLNINATMPIAIGFNTPVNLRSEVFYKNDKLREVTSCYESKDHTLKRSFYALVQESGSTFFTAKLINKGRESYTYGAITKDNVYIVSHYEDDKESTNVAMSGNKIIIFGYKEHLENFISFPTVEEASKKYQWLDGWWLRKYNGWQGFDKATRDDFEGAINTPILFTRWSDPYDGFDKKLEKFFYKVLNTVGRSDEELTYGGLNLSISDRIYKGGNINVLELPTITYMTEDMYQKYKGSQLIKYDPEAQKFFIKKADGTFLYIPEQYNEEFKKQRISEEQINVEKSDKITLQNLLTIIDSMRKGKFFEIADSRMKSFKSASQLSSYNH